MLDILKLLGRYEQAVLEGENLACLLATKANSEDFFDDDCHSTAFFGLISKVYNHLDNNQFISFLRTIYCFLDQPLPSSLEQLGHRNESDVTIILNGFVMLFLMTFDPEMMEEDEA